jgi:FtsZ-binding cell division protein ZapB
LEEAREENERLRGTADDLRNGQKTLEEENESLRKALEEIGEMWTGIDTASMIARAALAEEDV